MNGYFVDWSPYVHVNEVKGVLCTGNTLREFQLSLFPQITHFTIFIMAEIDIVIGCTHLSKF